MYEPQPILCDEHDGVRFLAMTDTARAEEMRRIAQECDACDVPEGGDQ